MNTSDTAQPGHWRRAWQAALLVFVVVRLLTAITAYATTTTFQRPFPTFDDDVLDILPAVFTAGEPLRGWLAPWYRYDTGWYLHIAYAGYQADPPNLIFAPLYPLLIRLLAPLTAGDYLLAALLISNAAGVAALALLFRFVERGWGTRSAWLTLLLYASFPTAFYLVAGYTESLFMALLLGAWLALLKRRYWLAGALALGASLTRTQAWLLALPFAYLVLEHLAALHGGGWKGLRHLVTHPLETIRRGLPAAPAVIGGPLGTALYVFGLPLAGIGSVEAAFTQPPWNTEIRPPWEALIQAWEALANGTAHLHDVASVLALVLVVTLGIVALRRLHPAYSLWVWSTLLFILLRKHDTYQLHGLLRYTLYFFPVFVMLALLLNRQENRAIRWATVAWIGVGFTLQLALVAAFSLWGWVS